MIDNILMNFSCWPSRLPRMGLEFSLQETEEWLPCNHPQLMFATDLIIIMAVVWASSWAVPWRPRACRRMARIEFFSARIFLLIPDVHGIRYQCPSLVGLDPPAFCGCQGRVSEDQLVVWILEEWLGELAWRLGPCDRVRAFWKSESESIMEMAKSKMLGIVALGSVLVLGGGASNANTIKPFFESVQNLRPFSYW